MSERDEKRGGSRVAIGCGLMLFVLPVLYVLSFGPAAWLAVKVPAAFNFLRIFYLPLGFIGSKFAPFARFLDWYMGLFV